MTRTVRVAAAQMGPIARDESRPAVVARLIELLRDAHARGAELVVFPELTLTTFFPRWFFADWAEVDTWFEASMPISLSTVMACGRTSVASVPALSASMPRPATRRSASAICERALLCVHRKSTRGATMPAA